MSSSTVLRVKRRLEDNPEDALVLMCKRKKTDSDADLSASLFVFFGTVGNQENNCVKSIIPKSDIKLKADRKVEDIVKKLRKERKEAASECRYEIVNCSRGLADKNTELEEVYDLVDLEAKSRTENDKAQYTYDLYTAARQNFDIFDQDNLVSIENIKDEELRLYYSHQEDGHHSSSSEHSDDSNDENNWRNDYPDSDHSSVNEEDLVRAVERCGIESDLSSDDERDIYDDPYKFSEDVTRYGSAYTKYKAKVLSELSEGNLMHSNTTVKDMDEESIEGYKSDSDGGFYYGDDDEKNYGNNSDRSGSVSDPD